MRAATGEGGGVPRQFGGVASYGTTGDRRSGIDAVVVAVPPAFHLELTLHALAAGNTSSWKAGIPRMEDYRTAGGARRRGW
jgi:hypothetical protein